MRAKWLWVTGLAGLVAACGEGHAIFNVDVYSFIKGTGRDATSYTVPPGFSDSASSTPQRVDLPGAGSSIVDSVLVNGRLDFQNQTGTGSIGLQLYIAGDSVGALSSSALALTVPNVAVSGTATVPDTIVGRFSSTVISLFTGKQLWFRFQAQGSDSGVTLLQGNAVLQALRLTVVLNDKFF
jgi:hypothetical protein